MFQIEQSVTDKLTLNQKRKRTSHVSIFRIFHYTQTLQPFLSDRYIQSQTRYQYQFPISLQTKNNDKSPENDDINRLQCIELLFVRNKRTEERIFERQSVQYFISTIRKQNSTLEKARIRIQKTRELACYSDLIL